MFKKIVWVILVLIIGGLGGIISDRYLFPYLSAQPAFQKIKFLKKATEDVTVINHTEQVYVKEDSSVATVSDPVVSSVVNIISYPNPDLKNHPTVAATKNGTGLIATSDGLIMTYATALNIDSGSTAPKTGVNISSQNQAPAYKYKVMTYDGNVYDASVAGIDSYSNLAFLKIDASNLPAVSLGDSDSYKPGGKIIAIGNGLAQYQNAFASGTLSQFDPYYNLNGQSLFSSEKLEGVFRTDLNGNGSYVGGPLIDYSGQVIGINGSLVSNNQTEYFAIPANKVKLILDRAIKNELNNDYQLGIYYIPITKSYALANNISDDRGVLIYSPSGQQGLAVISQTPAAAAGLKIGDIITQVNSEDINASQSLTDLLYKYQKGDQINLTVMRGGTQMTVQVQL